MKYTCFYVLSQILSQITLDEFSTGFAFTISAVLANRLLISVRERYYTLHGENSQWDTTGTSMQFRSVVRPRMLVDGTHMSYGDASSSTNTTTFGEIKWGEITEQAEAEYEMTEFSERRGF